MLVNRIFFIDNQHMTEECFNQLQLLIRHLCILRLFLTHKKIVWFENEYNKNLDKILKKSLENFAIKTNSFIKNISN